MRRDDDVSHTQWEHNYEEPTLAYVDAGHAV